MAHWKIGLLLIGGGLLCLPGSNPANAGAGIARVHGPVSHWANAAEGEFAYPRPACDPIQPAAHNQSAAHNQPAAYNQPADDPTREPAQPAAPRQPADQSAEPAAGQPAAAGPRMTLDRTRLPFLPLFNCHIGVFGEAVLQHFSRRQSGAAV